MAKAGIRFCAVLVFAVGAAFFLRNDAEAQEATVIVTAAPPSLVSVRPDGTLVYRGTVAGIMTATVLAVTGTVTGGNFVPAATDATGRIFITLRGLESCSIAAGCPAFGLEGADTSEAVLASLIAMDTATLSMFASSGANLNERFGMRDNRAYVNMPFYYWLARAGKGEHVSILVAAGASLEVNLGRGITPLDYALEANEFTLLTVLLSAGAELETREGLNYPALHRVIRRGLPISLASVLLAAGADVNSGQGSQRPLAHAVHVDRDISLITLLLSAGASITDDTISRAFTRTIPGNPNHSPPNTAVITLFMSMGVSPDRFLAAVGSNIVQRGESLFSIVTLILSAGANPNAGNILYWSARGGNMQYLTLLLSAGAVINNTHVPAAAELRRSEIILRLLQEEGIPIHQPGVDSRTAFEHILVSGGCSGIRNSSAAHIRSALLLRSVGARHHREGIDFICTHFPSGIEEVANEVIASLLAYNPPRNVHFYPALRGNGANINERLSAAFTANPRNTVIITALVGAATNVNAFISVAVESNPPDISIISVLLESGANPYLEFARAINQNPPNTMNINILLTAGADINATDSNGQTPLHYAARLNATGIIQFLVSAGASLEARDNNNRRTPFHYAAVYNSAEVVPILAAAGANANALDKTEQYRPRSPLYYSVFNYAFIANYSNGAANNTRRALIRIGARCTPVLHRATCENL